MTIRPITPDDYPQLRELWLRCEGMVLNATDDSPEGIARYLRRNPSTCFCAEENNLIAGVILCGHDGRRGYIYHTAVDPAFRRQGIGSALVASSLQALRDEHISKVALVAFSRNTQGNAFWEKQGFSQRDDLCYRNLSLTTLTPLE